MDDSTLFDLASLTKTFVAYAACSLALSGAVDLDEPVHRHFDVGLGEYADLITLRSLLTHTAGLPEEATLWKGATTPDPLALERVVRLPLAYKPGTRVAYSCVGYVAAGAVLESAVGCSLSDILHDEVFLPLAIEHTMFGPVARPDAAATESQPWTGRPEIRGEVHDELAWFLGGRVGNAGLFGTCADVATLADAFVGRGAASAEVVAMMSRPTPPHLSGSFRSGIGPRVGDPAFMADATDVGHTGFTGTAWVAMPRRRASIVILTNSVHRGRGLSDPFPLRRAICTAVAEATPT